MAYNTADLDDAFSAEMLDTRDIAASVPQYHEILDSIETQFPGASPREQFYESLRRLIDLLVSGLIQGTVQMAESVSAQSVQDVRTCSGRLASFTPETAETSRKLKGFLHRQVYSAPDLVGGRRESAAIIAELFQIFLDRPEALPSAYLEQAAGQPLHRVVCDYIGGMTDTFCRRVYEQITRPVATLPQ